MSNHNHFGRSYSRMGEGVKTGDYANALQHYAPRRDWADVALYVTAAIAVCVVAWACFYN